jgi:hypothetical protein
LKTILIIISAIFLSYGQIEYRYHPELNWKQFETEHFIVVFHDGTKNSAIRAAEIAESVYDEITAVYDYRPENKFYLIMKDIDDYSNGAAYFLDDKMEIYTEHLDYDLRGTHQWLKDVITHEFIHMIHIQKSLTSPKNVPFGTLQWIGYEKERRKDVVRGFPNRIVGLPILFFRIPPWLAEGVAQYQTEQRRYDYRDTQREMILRDRFLNDNILSLEELSIFGKSSIGNESVYNQGFSLVDYIVDEYGQESLEKISQSNQEFSALTDYSETVFTSNFGKSLEAIFEDWKTVKHDEYLNKTKTIRNHVQDGEIIHDIGEGNFYPEISPDKKYLSFVTSKLERSMYNNTIKIINLKTNEEIEVKGPISGQVKWFPDSKRIIYAKKTELNSYGSAFNDLYEYNIDTKEERRLTHNLRARNPIVIGDKVIFVTSYDGTSNLMSYDISKITDNSWRASIDWIDPLNRTQLDSTHIQRNHSIKQVIYDGINLQYITRHTHFEQYFHSTVLDDSHILVSYSDSYRRQIKKINIHTDESTDFIDSNSDIRNPQVVDGKVYVSSNQSNIFNIYEVVEGQLKPLTNVLGGAFMPTTDGKHLYYSLYKNASFNIAKIDLNKDINPEELSYEEPKLNASRMTLDKKIDEIIDPEIKRQPFKFNSFYAIPGLIYDHNRLKFGGTILVNELLERSSLLFSAFYNTKGERDIYGSIEFRKLDWFNTDPIFFLEVINQHVKIDDRIKIRFDENPQFITGDREVGFTLWQLETGFKVKLFDHLDTKLSYIRSIYEAELGPSLTSTFYDNGEEKRFEFPFFRYTYHDGNAFELNMLYDIPDRNELGEILPSKGMRYYGKIAMNQYRFLDDFAFNSTGLQEVFTNYFYPYLYLHSEHHFNLIDKSTSFTLDTSLEGNLKQTDEFYDVYAGGMIGLKGYPYFAIHGRQKWISSFKFHQLLAKDIAFDAGFMTIRNIALEPYFQIGDAWTNRLDVKSNIGLKLKADTYEILKLYVDFAYPLNEVDGIQRLSDGERRKITYEKELKYYFGLTYFFELKEFL